MPKRSRESDSDGKSPLKMRKIIDSTSNSTDFVDLTCDSDDSLDASQFSSEFHQNKNNSTTKKNASVTLKNTCEDAGVVDNNKLTHEERLERQDPSWIDEFFAESSSSEDLAKEESTEPAKRSNNLQSTDSGLQSLEPTQPSNTQEKNQGSQRTVDSGVQPLDVNINDDFDDLFDDEWDLAGQFFLDLSDFTRCIITEIDKKRMCIHVTVSDPNPDSNATALVICSGVWMDLHISVGESIIIKAQKSFDDWTVTNEWGYCVTQPDILVSGTTVTSSLFCNRKSILEVRFQNVNSLPNLKPADAAMTTGQIVHVIMQTALRDELHTLEEIKELARKVTTQRHTVQMLYGSDITSEDFKVMMDLYISKIHEFIERYINGKQPKALDKNFNGQIVEIRDIEENIWLPTLGLKGKIDVTVEVKVHNSKRRVMPLEIKTGRSLFSNEHRGQLYLYTMMMKQLGYDVESGLLLYIKDNQMQEVTSSKNDQRGLLTMRNLLAYYLSKPTASISNSGSSDEEAILETMELPQPIYHNTYCKEYCAHNSICCVYADADKNLSLSNHHPLARLSRIVMEELTDDHINYVVKWSAMLEMEEARSQEDLPGYNIWSLPPRAREKRKSALMCMEIANVTAKQNNYHHEFIRSDSTEDFPVKDFRQVFHGEEYITVSTNKRFSIASGFIISVKKTSLILRLERSLTKSETYTIDIITMRSQLYKTLGTLATLLAPNDITRRLRRLIIDREPARFTEPLPKDFETPGARKILGRLNMYQQKALIAVLTANDYVLIKGMPGTGKTETLVALIELLSYLGKSVIITAHTHNAVDNILLKLDQRKVDFMRLGSDHRLHPDLIHKSESVLTSDCDTPEKLRLVYDKQKIVGVTCLGAGHIVLAKRIFDYCVVDECTQVLQPVLLKPLYSAHKFAFVGDPQQLPAVIQSLEARKLGMAEDIFNRLDTPNNTRSLRLQYRMNETIMALANAFTYKGELCAGNEAIANATLKFKNPGRVENYEMWVQRALDPSLEKAVTVLNTGDIVNLIAHTRLERNSFLRMRMQKEDTAKNAVNWYEICVVQRLVTALMSAGINSEEIGVIAPFRAQINLLRTVIQEDVEINTVDQYQGRDKSVIVFSCTKSHGKALEFKGKHEYRILEDPKRLNVAMTRAKHKIIIVGNVPMMLEYGASTKELFSILEKDVVDLVDNVNDFSWDSLFKRLVELRNIEGSQ
ncbi:DNA replication ATP-dependent helicase/nuclease DNA2 [Fopius arisanus]|uniref:DNA replication ATP-dependent helicase/nuclease n=1 Tax=Fopius arisanus TaxID=64838 RepID=A0A0C9Q039_9HYME|nr:PREDICTED: DNA replication ATP-dependent helicase/nuclease DNA2 [Fopius arisanus]